LAGAILWAVAACASAPAISTSTQQETEAAAITALLQAQDAAWNRGDIEGFMSAYEPSEALRFASGGDVTRGWKATLERYRKGYPDSAAMGTLTFSDLEITPMGSDGAVVFGRWRLVREKDSPSGLFTLTLRRGPDGWRILQDHTSSAAKP
jgi:ketosteroid isomerase-like protein